MEYTTEQWYDLLLLGLAWRAPEEDGVVRQYGNGILHGLQHAGICTEKERIAVAKRADLALLVYQKSESVRVGRGHQGLRQTWDASKKDLLLLRPAANQLLNYAAILGSGKTTAYRLVITPVGHYYASLIAPRYAEVINKERFLVGWKLYSNSMRGLHTDR